MKQLILYFLIFLLTLFHVQGQPGVLDFSFGGSGYVTTDLNGLEETVNFVKVQDDGKIVISGENENNDVGDFYMARYLPDGNLDPGFGMGGFIIHDFSEVGDDDKARDFQILPGGKYMVAGRAINAFGRYELILVRLLMDGSLDNTFGDNGVVRHALPDTDLYMSNLHRLDNENYVLTGRIDDFGFADLALLRAFPNGSIDNSFGTDGYVFYDAYGSFDISRRSIILENGNIVTAGWAFDPGIGTNRPIMVMFNPNGTINSGFGINGLFSGPADTDDDQYRDLALYQNNHIITVGFITESGEREILVTKIDLNGIIDPGFGTGGHLILDYNGLSTEAESVQIQTDGKILAGVTITDPVEGENITALRMLQDGTPDPSYASDGWSIHHISNDDDVSEIVLQEDEKVILAGRTNDGTPDKDILLLRLHGDLTSFIQDTRSHETLQIFPNPATDLVTLHGNLPRGESIKIYDQRGKLVLEENSTYPTIVLDIQNLPSGLYFVSVGSGVGKFLKR
jgi:uncharacterized delta-60 repeat protein